MDGINTSRTTSSNTSTTLHLARWGLLHPTELPDDLHMPMGYYVLMLNTIVMQLTETSMSYIQLTSVHFVADNATHALASTPTGILIFTNEEEDVVISNGWTLGEREHIL